MTTTQWWREFADRAAVSDVLQAFALRPSSGRGETATYAFAHADCVGAHGDGRGAVFFGQRTRRLHCRKCNASFGVLELTAALLGDELPKAPWPSDDPVLRRVRDFGASHGWCAGDDQSRPRPLVPRPARKPQPAKWSPSRIAREFAIATTHPERWAGDLRAWCVERSWPKDIIDAVVRGGPDKTPLHDIGWAHDRSSELGRLGQLVGRPLLFAIRDGDGQVRSVSRRVAGPRQLQPKAMALASKLVGQSADWPGQCRAFGSIPDALDRCVDGGRIFLCEGGPDFMVASALVRLGFGRAALAGDSASALPRIAAQLAQGIRARRLRGVEVVLVPDLKWVEGDDAVGAAGMETRPSGRGCRGQGLDGRLDEVRRETSPAAQGRDAAPASDRRPPDQAMAPSRQYLGSECHDRPRNGRTGRHRRPDQCGAALTGRPWAQTATPRHQDLGGERLDRQSHGRTEQHPRPDQDSAVPVWQPLAQTTPPGCQYLGGEGLVRMRQAAEHLAGWAHVTEVRLPVSPGHDSVDLSDVAARCKSADHLMRIIEAAAVTYLPAYPDLNWPAATGYLPPVDACPRQVTVLRASLGTGKTQRAAELVQALPEGATAVAVTHRRSLSRQLAARLGLASYEDLPRGRVRESVAICVNSLGRLDPELVANNRFLLIDELESVLTHLFGATLAHNLPDRPATASVAGALRGLIRATLAAGGQVVLADAHAHEESVRALLDFAGLPEVQPQFIDHHTKLADTQVNHHPSTATLCEALAKHLRSGRRAAVATDSRRFAIGLAHHLRDQGHRVLLYTGDMPGDRRAELAAVERTWAPAACDAVIYTPVVDAGVSYDPEPADRFDATFGVFVGAANFGATTVHQMMFRARKTPVHHLYVADRTNECPLDSRAIRREIVARTTSAEHRTTLVGLPAPPRSEYFGALLDLETTTTRLQRLRSRRLRDQVLALYEVRGASPMLADDLPKPQRRRVERALRKANREASDARASRILKAEPLQPDVFDQLRGADAADQETADQLELSRLVRLVGAEHVDHDLVAGDERGAVTRAIQRSARLRLAFEGHWATLAEWDRLGLIDGFGTRRAGPDLPILAAVLEALLPRKFWLATIAPPPCANHPPDHEWSTATLSASGAHLKAATLLDRLAAFRGVDPDDCLAGIRTRHADLLTPQGACTFLGAVLRWAGLGTTLRRERRGDQTPLRIRRLDSKRWARMRARCHVECARVRGFGPDPLSPAAPCWTEATTAHGRWRAPVGAPQPVAFELDGGRIGVRWIHDPDPGSLARGPAPSRATPDPAPCGPATHPGGRADAP